MIEHLGLIEIADVQVDVADRGARRRASPRLALGRGDNAFDVERIRRHGELAVRFAPGAPGPIGVDLDAEAVGSVR